MHVGTYLIWNFLHMNIIQYCSIWTYVHVVSIWYQ